MTIFSAERISPHGGSLRLYASKDNRGGDHDMHEIMDAERRVRMDSLETYQSFAAELMKRIRELRDLFLKLKDEHKRVAGYGAPAKSSTMINSIGLDNALIQYIVEDAPLKQGLYMPGVHLPIYPPEKLREEKPDYILLLAWNYADAILKKEKELRDEGVKFILPVPRVKIM